MEPNPKRVAVVATGVIGASWAAFFLARGLDVDATDPSPGAEAREIMGLPRVGAPRPEFAPR